MVLPILHRELIVSSRSARLYHARLMGAGICLLVMAGFYLAFRNTPLGAGRNGIIFMVTAQIAFMGCVFAGPSQTADAIASEAREGTLGLLFLTHLRGWQIVLGKLAAHSITAIYGLLAMLPVLGLPMIYGGLSMGEFARMAVNLALTLFVSLSLGLLCSTFSKEQKKASGRATMLILFWWMVLPLLGQLLQTRWGLLEAGEFLTLLAPTQSSFDGPGAQFVFGVPAPRGPNGMTSTARTFTLRMVVLLIEGLIALALASKIVERTWVEGSPARWWGKFKDNYQSWMLGPPGPRAAFRREALDKNAFYWLMARELRAPRGHVTLVLMLTGLILATWLYFRNVGMPFGVAVVMEIFLLDLVLKLRFANAATGRIAQDRYSGALELILSTTLPLQELVKGHGLGLRRQFTAGIVLSICLEMAFLAGAFFTHAIFSGYHSEVALGYVLLVVLRFLDLHALRWMGLWKAVSVREPARAIASSIMLVVVAPFILLPFLITLLNWLSWTRPFMDAGPLMFITVWFIFCATKNLVIYRYASSRVYGRLRHQVAEQYQRDFESTPWWAKVWRWGRGRFSGKRAPSAGKPA